MESRLNKDALNKALKRLDDVGVHNILESRGWQPDDIDETLRLMIHTGCLIQPYGTDTQRRNISILVRSVMEHSTQEQLGRLAKHVLQAALLQIAFQQVKAMVAKTHAAKLTPAEHVWAVIERAMSELNGLIQSVREKFGPSAKDIEPLTTYGGLYLPSQSGEAMDADGLVNGLQGFLYLTLSMLAHQNKWWAKNGLLVLPTKGHASEEHLFKAGSHIILSTAWDILHIMSESLRFFGGEVIPTQEFQPEGTGRHRWILEFKRDLAPHLLFHVARLRLGQAETEAAVNWATLGLETYKDPREGVVLMPPMEHVSANEADAIFLLERDIYIRLTRKRRLEASPSPSGFVGMPYSRNTQPNAMPRQMRQKARHCVWMSDNSVMSSRMQASARVKLKPL